jgi:hypothetical protein
MLGDAIRGARPAMAALVSCDAAVPAIALVASAARSGGPA